jgi:hypothetical protein
VIIYIFVSLYTKVVTIELAELYRIDAIDSEAITLLSAST